MLPSFGGGGGGHQWYAADGLDVGCHVVAANTITACHGSHQPSVFVDERDAQPVVFQLAAHLKLLACQAFADALIPVGHLCLAVCVAQREHRVVVFHLLKFLIDVAAYALCGRVGVGHLGVSGLQVLQLAHQLVELVVADAGLVQYVVAAVVFVQHLPQLYYALFLFHLCFVVFGLQSYKNKRRPPNFNAPFSFHVFLFFNTNEHK